MNAHGTGCAARRLFVSTLALWAGLSARAAAAAEPAGANVSSTKVQAVLSAKDCPYQAEVKLFEYPPAFKRMHSHWYGLNMGRDGNLYVGVGDHFWDSHLYRYDPRTETITDLGGVKDALRKPGELQQDHGKIHVMPYQAPDGAVYFATHTGGSDKPYGGRVMKYTPARGLEDLGEMMPRVTYYFMHADEPRGKLYFFTVPQGTKDKTSHLIVRDIATGEWEDRGTVSRKGPTCGVTDTVGNLYVYSYEGQRLDPKKKNGMSITRCEVATGRLETVPYGECLWVGAVTPDGAAAYVAGYRTAEMYRFRFADWPRPVQESLGRIDPAGRDVYCNDLSLTPDRKLIVAAGIIRAGRSGPCTHGIWAYEVATGKKHLVAETTELLGRSVRKDMTRRGGYYTNSNTVDKEGWIYVGINAGPSDDPGYGMPTDVRLMAVRVTRRAE